MATSCATVRSIKRQSLNDCIARNLDSSFELALIDALATSKYTNAGIAATPHFSTFVKRLAIELRAERGLE
jgi:hypothetical protein